MLSIVVCSCLNKPEREDYLKRNLDKIYEVFQNSGIPFEILIGFDKYGKDIDGARCLTHDKGMGHSWNWGIKNAQYDYILQTEDDWAIKTDQDRVPDIETFLYLLKKRMQVIDKYNGIFRFTYTDDEFWSSGKKQMNDFDYDFLELNKPKEYKNFTWDMYYYTNHPHLKKKNLHEKVGYYLENEPPHMVEIDMCEKYFNSGERTFVSPFFTIVHIGSVQSRKS